jgi:ABC-type proline/glycine betaine transport system ATPase subunit
MEDGAIVEDGTPEELLHNPKNERTRQFIGRYMQEGYRMNI